MSNRVFVSVPSNNLTVAAITPTICSGGTAQIRVSASETEVFYQLYINGVATGVAVEGTGGDITLTSAAITATTSFTVQATPSSPANCSPFVVGSPVTVTVSAPSNQTTTLATSASICSGATASISLVSSEVGVTYQIYNGTIPTGFGVAGTGSAITLTTDALTSNASLRVFAVRSGCSTLPIGSTYAVTVTPTPTVFSFISSQQVVCAGGTVSITLPSSQSGVVYQIYNGATASGNPVTSNGGAITLTSGALTSSTTLTVQAISAGNCGNVTMEGYIAVTVNPAPVAVTISSNISAVCGSGNATISASSGLVNGVTYQLYRNGVAEGSAITYTGSNAVSFTAAVSAATTNFTVVASNASCPSVTSNQVTVTASPTPVSAIISTNVAAVCGSGNVTITATGNLVNGASYRLFRNGVAEGGSISYTGSNPVTFTASISATTKFTVIATSGSCPSATSNEVTVTVNPAPIAPAITASNASVCGGTPVSITVSSPVNGYSYQLFLNGSPSGSPVVANGTVSFTASAAGTYSVRATSNTCESPVSNEVTISSTPAFTANAGSDKTFCSTSAQGSKSVILEASATPTGTNGFWTVVSKPTSSGNPVFADASNPATSVSGLSSGTYVFRWTVSSTSCGSQSDEVTITLDCEAEIISSTPPKAVSEYQNGDVLFTFGDSDAPITAFSIDGNYSIPGVSYQLVNGQLRMYVSDRTALRADLYLPTIRTTDANGGTSMLSPTVIIGTPLPVTLTSFTASATNNGVQLRWSTASEKDNQYFQVERSLDARNFVSIGQVKGNGTTNTAQQYRFTDASAPAGTVYYRLKQVDVNGTSEYSKVISVQASGTNAAVQVSVAPNPFFNDLSVTVNSREDRTVLLELYDLNQKLILKETTQVSAGKVTITKDLSKVANGIYFLRVTGPSLSEVIRVMKKD